MAPELFKWYKVDSVIDDSGYVSGCIGICIGAGDSGNRYLMHFPKHSNTYGILHGIRSVDFRVVSRKKKIGGSIQRH